MGEIKIKKIKKKIFVISTFIIFLIGFNTLINIYLTQNSTAVTSYRKNEDQSKLNLNYDSTVLGDLSDVPTDPNDHYNYYRNKLLEQFNLTLSDYYCLSKNDTILFDKYVFALWGYENGTLTKEEAQELIKHNSPSLTFSAYSLGFNGYIAEPTLDSLKRHDDEEFRLRFKLQAGSVFGERITKVDAWLEEWHILFPDLLDPEKVHQLDIQEFQDDFSFGHESGNSWVGYIWGAYGIYLDAVMNPNFLDSHVKVYFIIEWEWYDIWAGWRRKDPKIKLFNQVISSFGEFTLGSTDWWLNRVTIPLSIIDDDTTEPYILDVFTMANTSAHPIVWTGGVKPSWDVRNDLYTTGEIQENQVNGFHEDQVLIVIADDKSFDKKKMEIENGKIHLKVWADNPPWPPGYFSWNLSRIRYYIPLPYWNLKIPVYKFGFVLPLKPIPKGVKFNFSIRIEDEDNDRPGDTLFSDEFNFTLFSEAPLPPAELPSVGQLISNFADIFTDPDCRYYDTYTQEEYDVVPFKQLTEPTELKLDLHLNNTYDYPIRVHLNYTQFENSPRLTTTLNLDNFKIKKNGENGRENIYEGFGFQLPNIIEETYFSNHIDSSIQDGGIGSSDFWIELNPNEEIYIENFLTIKVNDLSIIDDDIKDLLINLGSEGVGIGDIIDMIASSFWDFIAPELLGEVPGAGEFLEDIADFYIDERNDANFNADLDINSFFHFNQIPLLSAIISTCKIGFKVEEIYYATDFDVVNNKVYWNKQNKEEDPKELKDLLSFSQEEDKLRFDYDEISNFYMLKILLIPTDDQLWALQQFFISLMGMSMLQCMAQQRASLNLFLYLGASGMNAQLYHYLNIANGVDPIDEDYDQKASPDMMDIPIDLFPELLEDNELAKRTLSFTEKSYQCEQSLFGLYISMNRYHTAIRDSEWAHALNQLEYALNFSKQIRSLTRDFNKDLAFILANVTEVFRENSIDVFSNENLKALQDNFIYDQRYLTCLENQANFRIDDTNDNSFELSKEIIESNQIHDLRRIFIRVANELPYSYNMKQIYNNFENTFKVEMYRLQVDKLNLPVIEDQLTLSNIDRIALKIGEAIDLFENGNYRKCIEILEKIVPYSIDNFTLTRNSNFYLLYMKSLRLLTKAQKYNQISLQMLDDSEKEVKNGQTVEYLFQVYNDININMEGTINKIAPQFEILGLPSDFVSHITYLNSTELIQDIDNTNIIVLNGEETKLLKLIIEIPENSPYENEIFNFQLNISQNFGIKCISAIQDLTLKVVDDDTTPPEVSLEYEGESTDGNPGFIAFEIKDNDIGSEGTGFLEIKNLTHTLYSDMFPEGAYIIDLKLNQLNNIGEYNITLYAENNDEDGNIDDEELIEISIEIAIIDDDTTPPEINFIYTGDYTDGNSGEILVSCNDDSGLSYDESGLYNVPNDTGLHIFKFTAIDADSDRPGDSLTNAKEITINIMDDDIRKPEINNLIIDDSIFGVQITFNAFDEEFGDDKGLEAINIWIDDEKVLTYNPLVSETFFDFLLPNNWIMEYGIHNILIEIWDTDDDRDDDSLSSKISRTFITSLEEMNQYILWELDQLIEDIQESSDDSWQKKNSKATIINKLIELKSMTSQSDLEEAYDKLLHDIKPKLTGLKTDENENSWGNGVFKNPWVNSLELQEIFCVICNEILTDITISIQTISTMEYTGLNYFNDYNSIVLNVKGMGGIYGYNIFLLIGLISITLLFLYFRRKKNN